MSYNLAKLEHADLVKEAIEIMQPIFKDKNYRIGHIETNSADSVKFYFDGGEMMKGTVDLYALSKAYPSGIRTEVAVYKNEYVAISFFNVLSNRSSIILFIKLINENKPFVFAL